MAPTTQNDTTSNNKSQKPQEAEKAPTTVTMCAIGVDGEKRLTRVRGLMAAKAFYLYGFKLVKPDSPDPYYEIVKAYLAEEIDEDTAIEKVDALLGVTKPLKDVVMG
jgi:hypothetical protein